MDKIKGKKGVVRAARRWGVRASRLWGGGNKETKGVTRTARRWGARGRVSMSFDGVR